VTKKNNNSPGRVFQIIYRDRKVELDKTSTWFLKYRIGGMPVTIPSGTQDYEEAVAILQQKIDKATQLCRSDEFPSVVINQLLDLVIDDYRSKDRYTTYAVATTDSARQHGSAIHVHTFMELPGSTPSITRTAAKNRNTFDQDLRATIQTPASRIKATQCMDAIEYAVSVVRLGISPPSSKRFPRSSRSAANIHSS
jgi:hypothetical protein